MAKSVAQQKLDSVQTQIWNARSYSPTGVEVARVRVDDFIRGRFTATRYFKNPIIATISNDGVITLTAVDLEIK